MNQETMRIPPSLRSIEYNMVEPNFDSSGIWFNGMKLVHVNPYHVKMSKKWMIAILKE